MTKIDYTVTQMYNVAGSYTCTLVTLDQTAQTFTSAPYSSGTLGAIPLQMTITLTFTLAPDGRSMTISPPVADANLPLSLPDTVANNISLGFYVDPTTPWPNDY